MLKLFIFFLYAYLQTHNCFLTLLLCTRVGLPWDLNVKEQLCATPKANIVFFCVNTCNTSKKNKAVVES